MATELEELVGFFHHGNSQIRQIASTNLLGYSTINQDLFKTNKLEPIKDLKLLVKDYPPISKNALIILVNLSEDKEILKSLATDDEFFESLLLRITSAKEANANEIAMLLANLAKDDSVLRLLQLHRSMPKPLSTSPVAIDQLMDCFVKGAGGSYNKEADYDYLSYLFADLAKHEECRTYFLTPQATDANIIPLSKILVFTEHTSHIRRLGVASTIKNVAFDIFSHPKLLVPHYVSSTPKPLLSITNRDSNHETDTTTEEGDSLDLLPYILLPLCGPSSASFSDEDMEDMLEDLQLLPADKKRENDVEILKTHLETLLLLTTTKEGRETLRKVKVYPVVRELHVDCEDEGVREGIDRLVQVLLRDEEGEGEDARDEKMPAASDAVASAATVVKEEERAKEEERVKEVDSDDEVVEVF